MDNASLVLKKRINVIVNKARAELEAALADYIKETLLISINPMLQKQNLSRRQTEVLDRLVMQKTNKEIAWEMHISERTVKYYVGVLLKKYGVDNRVALSRLV